MSRPRAYLLALALCLTLAGVHSPPAAAGRYEVAACGDDGVNRSWTLTYGGPGGYTTGASSCPGGPGWITYSVRSG